MPTTIETFDKVMNAEGWFMLEAAIDSIFIERLRQDLESAYATCREIQLKNGIGEKTDGTVHHILGLAPSFLELLERRYLVEYIEHYFGGLFILNSFGGVINLPLKRSYVNNIHRDVRTWTGSYRLMINMLVMLDDFTEANGATWLLPGSHHGAERICEAAFFQNAIRAVGSSGSILLFDSNIWHCAGENKTDKFRRALTLSFSRPLMKQQLDYPRCLGYDQVDKLSDWLKQVVGYNSRIPTNLDEWYQPIEKRLYKADQG
jgi:Phytanoyl-CoA dioxygenase (PhyH)